MGRLCLSRGNDFRPNYNRLGDLRSFLRKDVRFVALTATSTREIKDEVCKSLHIEVPSVIYIPMERANLYYEVLKSKVGDNVFINWLLAVLRSKQKDAPKVIIYCRNVKTVAEIYDMFHLGLGKSQYINGIVSFRNRLFAMYHRSTTEENKSFVLEEFKKPDSNIRVVFATSSFEMGLDFPDVSIVVNFSVPRSLESFAQQSGRGGRGIPQAYSLVVCQGSTSKKTSTVDMRQYAISSSVCRRVQLRKYFSLDLNPERDVSFEVPDVVPEGCKCCDVCRMKCACGSCVVPPWNSLSGGIGTNDQEFDMELDEDIFTDEKLSLLRCSLDEYREEVYEVDTGARAVNISSWKKMVDQILISCPYIFSIDDLLTETRLDDISLAEDLYSIIVEVGRLKLR